MSNHIGRASILLTADTASFESEIVRARDTAQGALGDIRQQAIDMGQALKTGMAMGTVAFGALSATVGVAVKEQMELVNVLSSIASRANTTTAEIQKYTFAAKAMGIEQDKLGDIFKDTQDKVGDFLTTGGGELKDFFELVSDRVGVTAEQFRTLSGPEALQLYHDSLEKANLSQSEMIFYLESIADDASLLIPLLKNGGEGFRLWEDAAKNAGAVMDEKTIKATQELNTSTQLLNLSYQGVKNQLAIAVIPVMSDMAGALVKDTNLKNTATKAGELLAGSFKVIIGTGRGVVGIIQMIGTAIGGMTAVITNPLSAVEILKATYEDLKTIVRDTNGALDGILSWGNGGTNATVSKLTNIQTEQEQIRQLGAMGKDIAEQKKKEEEAKKEAQKQKAKSEKEKAKSTQAFKLNPNDPNSLKAGVYLAYRNAGLNHKQAVAITAEVGRENDFNAQYIFGYHKDLNQKGVARINLGMLSWNGNRGRNLEKQLHAQGLLQQGKMARNQDSLNAMARFSVAEMKSDDYRGYLKNFWNNSNADYETLAKEMGGKRSYVGWAMYQNTVDGKPFDWLKHHNKRKKYAHQLDGLGQSYQAGKGFDKVRLGDALDDIKQHEKEFQEAQRQAERQAQDRLNIEKEFADEKTRLLFEYKSKEKAILEAGFNEADQKKYLKLAEAQYQNGLDLLQLEQDKRLQASIEYRQTEAERIVANANLERRSIALNTQISEELRTAMIEAVNHKERQALAQLNLDRDKAWQTATEYKQTEAERIKANAELERREIWATVQMDEELRQAKIDRITHQELQALEQLQDAYRRELDEMTSYGKSELQRLRDEYKNKRYANQARTDIDDEQKRQLGYAIDGAEIHAVANLQNQARGQMTQLQAELGGVGDLHNIETQHKARLDLIKNLLDSEVMTVEEAEKAKRAIRVQYAQDMLGVLSSSAKSAFGEQSRAYQMMFAMQKGVAIAQASIAMYQNISQAMSKGFPANVPLIAQAMTQGMGIIANIKAIKSSVVGQAHDGIMSVPKSGTWNLEKGERVLPKHTAQNLDDKLAKIDTGRSETKIIINNYSGEKTDVQQMPNGDFMVVIGKQMQQVARYEIAEYDRKRKRQGWS